MRLALLAISTFLVVNAYAKDLVLADDLELSMDTMDSSRGGQYIMEVDQYHVDIDSITASSEVNGVSLGNSAINTTNGNNNIGAGAFSAASGINSVIQNTGNNVLIQNSTVVNLTLK
ncbi:carbon storage regulator [Vibrio ponticus]|uniref:Carbon storage regulator n=1 Tax=Vibrio ponticus TaxID=265668 RepID=A0A3N3DSN3_9VIBR|nr:carbon storage regulator [Vibrio ponticus]ROV57460.1 carbon storage regulator [Vibrio ponticus]